MMENARKRDKIVDEPQYLPNKRIGGLSFDKGEMTLLWSNDYPLPEYNIFEYIEDVRETVSKKYKGN